MSSLRRILSSVLLLGALTSSPLSASFAQDSGEAPRGNAGQVVENSLRPEPELSAPHADAQRILQIADVTIRSAEDRDLEP